MDENSKGKFLEVKQSEIKNDFFQAIDLAYDEEDEYGIHKAFVVLACAIEKISTHEDYEEMQNYWNEKRKISLNKMNDRIDKTMEGINGTRRG